jgi:hypothetical protein
MPEFDERLGSWLMAAGATCAVLLTLLAGLVLALMLYTIYSGLAGFWDIEAHEKRPACTGQNIYCENPYAPDLRD